MDKQADMMNFDMTLVAGGIKGAMKELGASSSDLWQVGVNDLVVMDDFNTRVDGPELQAHIRGLADSMKEEGYKRSKPIEVFVARVGDKQVLYVTDGHCRLAAVKLAISEGAEILKLPVVPCAAGTSLEDITVGLVRANTGRPLTTYEIGLVCKRLSKNGWDSAQIAKRLILGTGYVESLLLLVSAPRNVRELVEQNKVSATNAIQALKAYGDKAYDHLNGALERAQGAGAAKVTAKHMAVNTFKAQVKKTAPKLFDLLTGVKSDPGYGGISETLREKLDALMEELEKAKGAQTAVAA